MQGIEISNLTKRYKDTLGTVTIDGMPAGLLYWAMRRVVARQE